MLAAIGAAGPLKPFGLLTCALLDAGRTPVIRQAQWSDEEQQHLAAFPTAEAANEFLRIDYPET